MKLKFLIISIVAFLLTACSVQYNLQSHIETSFDVSAESDSASLSIIAPYKAGIDSIMNEVLCISEIDMTKGKPESLLGNFVTDLCLQQYSDIADICVMNNGGLRSSLTKGKITRGDIYTLMPFENKLVILELDKKSYLELLQYIIKRGGEPFSGIKIRVDENGIILSQSLDLSNNKVKVLTSDYLANGGDKMSFFNEKKQELVGVKVRDAIINHCLANDTIASKLDNRLSIVK
jgi:2',3'-cyclic-nucleotide 2'-phosphodiesterase (5'-nucleotidase family)